MGSKKLFYVLEQTTWEGIVYDKVVAKYRYRWLAYAVARLRNWIKGERRYHVAVLQIGGGAGNVKAGEAVSSPVRAVDSD